MKGKYAYWIRCRRWLMASELTPCKYAISENTAAELADFLQQKNRTVILTLFSTLTSF